MYVRPSLSLLIITDCFRVNSSLFHCIDFLHILERCKSERIHLSLQFSSIDSLIVGVKSVLDTNMRIGIPNDALRAASSANAFPLMLLCPGFHNTVIVFLSIKMSCIMRCSLYIGWLLGFIEWKLCTALSESVQIRECCLDFFWDNGACGMPYALHKF